MKEFYSYKEIENKYHILSPIERDGKRILICVNKKNSCYSFFVDNFISYSKADEPLKKELSKVYRKSKPGIWEIKIKTNITSEDENLVESKYNELFENCKKLIELHLGNKNENFKKAIYARLNTITLYIDEQLPGQRKGYYCSAEHSIHITKQVTPIILLHEMLHAVSSKGFSIVGYSQMVADSVRDISIYSGEGFTEGATQYHTELALGNKSAQSNCIYRHSVNLYYNLVKGLDADVEKQCFVLDAGELLKEEVIKYFKLENDELYDKFFYQMDAILCIEKNYKSGLNHDYINLAKNAYQTLINMYQIKLCAECRFKEFDECITFDFVNPSKQFAVLDERIKNECITYYENNMPYVYEKDNESNIRLQMIKFARNCADNSVCNASDFPNYFKSTDYYAATINGAYACTSKKYDKKTLTKKIVKTLLDPKNGFMPNDEEERKQFIYDLIAKTDKERINMVRMIPPNYIKFCIENKDLSVYGYNLLNLCSKDPQYFIETLHHVFNSTIISSVDFIYGFQDILNYLDNIEDIKPTYEKFKTMMKKEYHSTFDFSLMDKEIYYVVEDRKDMQK